MFYKLILLTLLTCCYATPPPGYVKPSEDKYPPKYEYGYNIEDNKGSGQGKLETREGVFSLGRYYVQLGAGLNGASQNVEYITDEWGYHPLVEYSSSGAHSQTSTQFALGEKAVEALKNSNNKNQPLVSDQIKQKALHGTPLPSPLPTTITPAQSTSMKPLVTPIPEKRPSTNVRNFKIHNPYQENVPALQNAIPLQYVFQSVDIPQAQYLIQPQISQLQSQFYLQDQQPLVIPLYQPQLEIQQNVEQGSNFQKNSFNNNKEKIHVSLKNRNYTIQEFPTSTSPSTIQESLASESYLLDNFVKDYNKGQYLKEDSHPGNKNLVVLSKNAPENGVQIQNNGYVSEQQNLIAQSTGSFFEKEKHSLDQNRIVYDESILGLEHPGGYGSKINARKLNRPPDIHTKLIDRTRNLITGIDVLNINDAITNSESLNNENKNFIYDVNYNVNVPNTILQAISNKQQHHEESNEFNTNFLNTASSNTRNNLIELLNSEQIFNKNSEHISFKDKPIVVADLEEENVPSTSELSEHLYSTTQNTVETKITGTSFSTTETPVLITNRPVSDAFLAPITAAVSLQNSGQDLNVKEKQKFYVEIQKSVPYYLGKIEYLQNQELYLQNNSNYLQNESPKAEALISNQLNKQEIIIDDEVAESTKIVNKPVEFIEKPVAVPVPQPYAFEVEKIIEKQVPVEITKYIDKPYPVHVPYPEPIAVPVEVEKLVRTIVKEPYPVEVPVPIQVPVKVPVPHPVPVTKYIEKPVTIERIIEKPVHVQKIVEKPVTKYVEKPYPVPVHVPVPHPIAIPVEIKVPQPYPVEVTKYVTEPHAVPSVKHVKTSFIQHQQHQNPVAYPSTTKLVHVPFEIPKYNTIYQQQQQQPKLLQNTHVYAPQYQLDWQNLLKCDHSRQQTSQQLQQESQRFVVAKIPEYIGLVPPQQQKTSTLDFVTSSSNKNYKRRPRNSFGQNLRIEYGFKPPMIPSVQTDEFGMPLKNQD